MIYISQSYIMSQDTHTSNSFQFHKISKLQYHNHDIETVAAAAILSFSLTLHLFSVLV